MSRRVKKEKLDLLTTDLYYKVLVGESVLRFSFTKDLLVEDEPARDRGKPFPLSNVAARVSPIAAGISEKDRINLEGSLEGRAVFYGKEGTKEITWSEAEFYREAELRGARPGMEVTAHGRVAFISEEESPLEAEGKLLYQLKIEVEVLLAVTDPQQLAVAVGVKDIAPERVTRGVLTAEELILENTFHFNVTKEVEFTEEVNYTRIVNCFLQDFSYEWGREAIDLKGELVVTGFVLTGGKGNLREIRQRFSQQVPFPEQKKEDLQVSLFPSIGETGCDSDGKIVHYRVAVDVFARVTRAIRQEVIVDIQESAVKKEYLLLPKVLGVVKEPLELVQKLAFTYPREIAAGFCRFGNLDISPRDDRLGINGLLEKNVYYFPAAEQVLGSEEEEVAETGLPLLLKVEDDFVSELYLPGVSPGTEIAVYFQPRGTEYVSTENDTLQISHVSLELKAWEAQEFAVVVPSRVPPGTSVVIYAAKPGDTLLKIGRAYGLKSEVIAVANGLEEDAGLTAGQKLLIPLMFGHG